MGHVKDSGRMRSAKSWQTAPNSPGMGRGICRPVLTRGLIEPDENAPIDSPVVAATSTICPGGPPVMRKEQ